MTQTVLTVIIAVLSGPALVDLLKFVKWAWRRWRDGAPDQAEKREIHEAVAQADESILSIARSREALERDNERLRREMAEKDTRHDEERRQWRDERAELRKEIDALEERLRTALGELGQLRARHGLT